MTGDADLLGGETENEGPFVGMQGPLERGEWKSFFLPGFLLLKGLLFLAVWVCLDYFHGLKRTFV